MNLELRQLQAFEALARERSFTRAAVEMHLSQPAFSALIHRLETTLGVRLFDRSTRSVEPTAEGEAFEEGARRILDEVRSTLFAVGERVAKRRGRVSIALLPSLAADWLPEVLAEFRTLHPDIEIEVADVLSEPCIEAVRQGRADFALAPTRAETPELTATRFCSDGFRLVCAKDHPLAKRSPIRLDDVRRHPFIHLGRSSSVRQYLDAATHPWPLRAVLEVDQLATVAGMVRAGLGISIVPALSLYQFGGPGLALRTLDWPGLRREIYLVRRRDRSLSVAASALHAFVIDRRPRDGGVRKTTRRVRR